MSELSQRAGQRLHAHVKVSAERASPAAERARLVERATAAPRPRPWLFPSLATVLVAAVVIAGLRIRSTNAPSPITFVTGAGTGQVGTYVASVGHNKVPLRFSDGSVVTLEPDARARVVRTTPHGASIVLETGTASVHVVHRRATHWSIAAGPYIVAVTGTSFLVTWTPASSELDVQMRSGVVRVTGPGIESGVEVRGTEHFVTSTAARVENLPASAGALLEARPPPSGLALDTSSPRPSAASPATAPDRIAVSRLPANGQSWAALAAQGRYREVLKAARQRGMNATLTSASARDLAILADAARFSGQNDLAERALLAVRSRFPQTPQAHSAAFLLGRLADERGAPSAAVGWYDRYLAEAPSGGLVPEALGRRMLALKKAGDVAGSRKAALDYLRRFPNGPYAGVAREVARP